MYFLEENVHGFENASAGRLLPECNCGKNTEGDCYQILREEEEETHWPKPLNKRKGSNRGKRWVGVGVEDQRRSEIEEMYYSSDKRKQLLLNSQLYHSSCFDTLGIGRRWAGLRDAGEELEESEEMEESEESEEMEDGGIGKTRFTEFSTQKPVHKTRPPPPNYLLPTVASWR
jgi:hypothetical protein